MEPVLLERFRWAALAAVSLLGVGIPTAAISAQDAFPKIEVRQVADHGSRALGGSARVKLDRDAFVVVIELGVDGRARVVFPESPRVKAFVRAERTLDVPLPSADVMFVRTQRVSTPTIVAFASDVAPDLSAFTDNSSRWDFQYALDFNGRTADAVRDLATLIYGDPDMPHGVSKAHIAPVLSAFAQRQLLDCGFLLSGYPSVSFANFLWDLYGPWFIHAPLIGASYLRWQDDGGLGSLMPFGLSAFARSTTRGLWDRYGAGCDGLRRAQPFTIAILESGGDSRYNADGVDTRGATVPPPRNRTGGDSVSTVDGVSLVPASPAAIARRANAVTIAVNSAEGAVRDAPVREAHEEMIQRAEVARMIALLASGTSQGRDVRGQLVRARSTGGSAGNGGAGEVTRTGTTTGSGGGSTGVGGSAGGGSAGETKSVGSGSSSAGEASRGGSAGGGRAGVGGRTPPP